MESLHPFTLKLKQIASRLETKDLDGFKFLCKGCIYPGDLEKLKTYEQLFLALEQRRVIAPNNIQFLIACFESIGRKDLAEDLRNYVLEGLTDSADSAGSASSNSLDLTIEEAESYNSKGRVAFQEGRYEDACQQYTAALECLPRNVENDAYKVKYLCNRAASNVKQRKFKEACEDCEKALLLNPRHEKARYRLAQALQGQGEIAKAFEQVAVLMQINPLDPGIGQLWSSVKKEVEDDKEAAMKKNDDGHANFLNKRFDEAIRNFSEGILLLPNVAMYKEEMMQFCWKRAECYLRKNDLENAKRDCEEANRLVPEQPLVLNTMMQILERMNLLEDCYAVCNKLIKMKIKEKDAENTISRILPKMLNQDEESNQRKANAQLCESAASSKRGKKRRKKSKKKKSKDEGLQKNVQSSIAPTNATSSSEGKEREGKLTSPTEDDELTSFCSTATQSLFVEENVLGKDIAADKTLTEAEFSQGNSGAGRTAEVEELEVSTSTAITGLLDNEIPGTCQEKSWMIESVPSPPEAEDKGMLYETEASYLRNVKITLPDFSTGNAYPRRILFISHQWSCWQHSVCTVNRQLCRSFAKREDVHVACLLLDKTDQETIAATRDGVSLIKAAPQHGISQGDKQLLCFHSVFPFKVDLVIGHGMVSGTAAAIQAKRLDCKRLHIFHNLPGTDEVCRGDISMDREETERDLGLSADFKAGLGPLVVERWQAILNCEVFTIIPGLPNVAPRNNIMTPQCRCLLLGDMKNPAKSGLHLIKAALRDCKQRERALRLTVVGTERKKVQDLREEMASAFRSSRVQVVVKPFDMSQEAVGVEVRGVSLVLIPSPSDGFGVISLEAIAAKVPVLISSSSGIAHFLQKQFGYRFLDLLCTTEEDADWGDAWADAIDKVLDDREKAFRVAESLWDKWNVTFTWDSAAIKLLEHLSSSGVFSLLSPLGATQITLPSQCSNLALRFIEEEVDLLNRRRKHVLFLSPENLQESPFIRYFAQVPWAAVFDFDVNSVRTGFLASCENFYENTGMKVCRILPPSMDEERKKCSAVLLTGIPWVLLEGMPESKRSIRGNLEWVREFFLALGKRHQVPITFLVLWKSTEKTKSLSKRLFQVLTVVEGSSLLKQVKLVIASTGDAFSSHLEDISENWGVEVQRLSLEDICNALCQCVYSSPLIEENQDFSLPVVDPDDPHKIMFKVLPPSSRWVIAEVEVLFQSVGSTPQFETDDACHFYRGGLISWYALEMGYAVERSNWKALKARVDELLLRAGSVKLKMPHRRGTGGSTSARKILYDYHEKYPCVLLKSVGHAEVAQGIKVLAEFCKLPVIVLVDYKQTQSDEFDVDALYNVLANDRIPCVILEVIHQNQKTAALVPASSRNTEKRPPVCLADTLQPDEAQEFVHIYSAQRKGKLSMLRSLLYRGPEELQIPFFYALTTFEDRFTGLEPFVRDCIQDLDPTGQKILLFLAMAYHYGHSSLSANEFADVLQAPRRDLISLETVLPEEARDLLLEEDGKWRPRHDLLALEMLRQLLTVSRPKDSPVLHLDNWKNRLAEKAVDFFSHMSETVISDVLLSRVPDNTSHQYISFSPLISDIPFEEDAIKLFEKAISLFPDNPFFKVHLGRFYSIQKKSAGFSMAIKYTDEGICYSQNYSRLVRGQFAQMKGVVYSREVNYRIEQATEINFIIDMAEEGVKNFRRAVSIAPDFVDSYIPEVRMMCKVFEYIDHKTGDFFEYVKSPEAHPFITDAISDTSNTLECVPDSDEYPYWRMRLACLGRRKFTTARVEETLEVLNFLRSSGRASRGSINRQIVVMRMDKCAKNGESLSSIAPEMMELLNEALKYDNVEQTMRLWVKLSSFIPVALSESESKIFYWCSEERSVRSYLYKFIVACLHLLEGGSSTYREVMRNALDDLNLAIKAINRADVGRCRHPDRPVVWLGDKGKGMGHLVYLDEKISELKDVRTKRFIDPKYTKQLRPLTGLIVRTGPQVGTIRSSGELDVSFRADLCETPLVSSFFTNRKVQFFLAFTFFGTDAYNVKLVAE